MADSEDKDRGEQAPQPKQGDTNAEPWLVLIKDAQQYFNHWQEKADSIDKQFGQLKKLAGSNTDREFQMFWANMEVLKPSIYSRPPIPVVTPRFKDNKELPRKASELLERNLVVTFEQQDIDVIMRAVRDDMATVGRGVPWVRMGEEEVIFDHIERQDFLHEPARKWKEVGWVAKRVWLSREAGMERFGPSFETVQLKSAKERNKADDSSYVGEKKAEVWEIWSKTENSVVWVSPGVPTVLDVQDPFLTLDGFFPCPRPAYATVERGSLLPVPDYVYYKDQLEEINELTARISALCEGLRLKGFYAAGQGDLADTIEAAIKRTDQNAILIPVPNYAAMGAAGLKDSIVWLPVQEVANCIKELLLNRRQLIDDVYQITGLSDIMRGATDAGETATAQQLKSQYGSVRIKDRQSELVRVARDLTRMAAEIIAENFTPETMLSMAQMDIPTDAAIEQQAMQIAMQAQQAAQANPEQAQQIGQQAKAEADKLQNTITLEKIAALLKEEKTRPFILEIETDSTILPNEQAEKEARNEFLQVVGGFMSAALPLVQQLPEAAGLAGEMLKFAAGAYRAGRSLEGEIDRFVETIKKPKPPQPDPKVVAEQEKLKLKKEEHTQEMQFKAEEHKQDMQLQAAKNQGDMAMQQQKVAAQGQMNVVKMRQTAEAGQQKMQMDDRFRRDTATQDAQGNDQLAQQVEQLTMIVAKMAQAMGINIAA